MIGIETIKLLFLFYYFILCRVLFDKMFKLQRTYDVSSMNDKNKLAVLIMY